MMRTSFSRTRLTAGLLVSLSALLVGTACGAEELTSTTSTVQQGAHQKSTELESADQRVDQAKNKLDFARKQLSAAKASLKAAEAEFKANKANRDALSLRETATQLADASGFAATTPSEPVRQIIVPQNGNRLTPVSVPQPVVRAVGQPLDFNAQPANYNNGAPVPDLQPNNEPTIVP